MEIKVKVYLDEQVFNLIENDAKEFDLSKNLLFNKIITSLHSEIKVTSSYERHSKSKFISFNLNKYNSDFLDLDAIIQGKYESKSDYFRDIFYTYAQMNEKERANLLFMETYKEIKRALNQKKVCKIEFHKEIKIIEPYHLIVNPDEKHYYLMAYDYESDSLKAFKAYHVKQIFVTNMAFNHFEKKKDKVKNIVSNLTSARTLKVRFTQEGIEKYKKAKVNRPEFLKNDGNLYHFLYKEFSALLYFMQFYEHCEIIEPVDTRKAFHKELKNTTQTVEYAHYIGGIKNNFVDKLKNALKLYEKSVD